MRHRPFIHARRAASASGQAATEYALIALVLVAAGLAAAGPSGFLDAFRHAFDSVYFVLSLPVP